MIWKVREGGSGRPRGCRACPTPGRGGRTRPSPSRRSADYLRDLRKLLDKYDYHPTLYGHLGQGCIHTPHPLRPLHRRRGSRSGARSSTRRRTWSSSTAARFSGEHGDGQSRGEWLPKMFGPELMRGVDEFKRIWDPQWKMNPGKVVDPYTMTENLRLGPDYNPPQPQTHFHSRPTSTASPARRCGASASASAAGRAAGRCAPATW